MTDTVGTLHAQPSAENKESNERRLSTRQLRGMALGVLLALGIY